MEINISPEVLIPLVEQRNVIWDKTSNIYKDKGLKLAAWREICCVLDPNFDTLGKKERKDFVTKISTKWTHIRDAYMRSLKKEKSLRKEEKRSGAGVKTSRPYVYKKQLSFLMKVNNNKPCMRQDSSNVIDNFTFKTAAIDHQLPLAQKKTKTDTLDDKISYFLEFLDRDNQENPHVSFIKGVIPSLALFDDDEKLEFQMGILELIQKIKKKRCENNLYGE